jgi:hypothetical protein
MQDYLLESGSGPINVLGGDMETFTNHLRNGIYAVVLGQASTDSMRLELKITYEYVPCTTYKEWVDTEGPRAMLAD